MVVELSPDKITELFGVAHEPLDLGPAAAGDPTPRLVEEGAQAPRPVEEGAQAPRPVEEGAQRPSRNPTPRLVEEGAQRPSRNPSRRSSRRRGRAAEPPSDTEVDLGPAADPESVGRKILLDQLTGRARSRADLAKKLAEKDVPDEIAVRLLDRFEEVGLINDVAFAHEWVAQRQESRGLARRALAQELRRKGIDDEIARDALDTVEADDEVETARLLVQRKLRSVRGLDQQVAIRRLVGMLARKGYSSGVAFKVVRDELDADLVDPEHSGL